MALASIDQLKQYFEPQDQPTSEQFAALFEALMHRTDGDKLALDRVANLSETLNGLATKEQLLAAVFGEVDNVVLSDMSEIVAEANIITSGGNTGNYIITNGRDVLPEMCLVKFNEPLDNDSTIVIGGALDFGTAGYAGMTREDGQQLLIGDLVKDKYYILLRWPNANAYGVQGVGLAQGGSNVDVSGIAVNAAELENHESRITTLEELNGSTTLEPSIDSFAVFNGSTSTINLDTPITLSAEGSFLEIEFYATDLGTFGAGMGAIGQIGTGNSSIGLWSNGQLYVRDSGGSWMTQNGTLIKGSSLTPYLIRLEWGASNISVYSDGVFQKTITKSDFIVANLGKSYQSFHGGVGTVKIYDGTTLIEVDNPLLLASSSVDVELGLKSLLGKLDPNVDYANMMYDLTSSRFIIYQNIGGDRYSGLKINRTTDLSADAPYDIWRITGASRYVYDGATMLADGVELLFTGDSEFVYKHLGRPDFAGGWHGNETLIEFMFLVNGLQISTAVDIPLTICRDFVLTQKSHCHDGNDTVTHLNESLKNKIIDVTGGGYKIYNRLELLEPIEFATMYVGLACISTGASNQGYSNIGTNTVFDNSGTVPFEKSHTFFYRNEDNKMTSSVKATLLNPSDKDVDSQLQVLDRTSDNKYYRGNTPTGVIPAGTVYETEMVVTFKYFYE